LGNSGSTVVGAPAVTAGTAAPAVTAGTAAGAAAGAAVIESGAAVTSLI
jgi:hypothetical protein